MAVPGLLLGWNALRGLAGFETLVVTRQAGSEGGDAGLRTGAKIALGPMASAAGLGLPGRW